MTREEILRLVREKWNAYHRKEGKTISIVRCQTCKYLYKHGKAKDEPPAWPPDCEGLSCPTCNGKLPGASIPL